MVFRRREVEGGYVAVGEEDGVHSSEPVRSLPVDAEQVVMTMPMGRLSRPTVGETRQQPGRSG